MKTPLKGLKEKYQSKSQKGRKRAKNGANAFWPDNSLPK